MRSLAKALEDRGETFPFPWSLPVTVYPGFVVEVLAAPKVGKSIIALNWAVQVAELGMPVLYHTPDTDYSSQAQRLVARLQGITQAEVAERRDYYTGWLEGTNLPIRWSQAKDLDISNFAEIVYAEREYLGEFPKLVIVDVAMDLMRGQEDVGNVRNVFRQLKKLAHRTGSVIAVLHHVKRGDAANGIQYVGMADGLWGGEQVVEAVVSLWRAGENKLAMHLAANRQGPSGQTVYLNVDYARASVYE